MIYTEFMNVGKAKKGVRKKTNKLNKNIYRGECPTGIKKQEYRDHNCECVCVFFFGQKSFIDRF